MECERRCGVVLVVVLVKEMRKEVVLVVLVKKRRKEVVLVVLVVRDAPREGSLNRC